MQEYTVIITRYADAGSTSVRSAVYFCYCHQWKYLLLEFLFLHWNCFHFMMNQCLHHASMDIKLFLFSCNRSSCCNHFTNSTNILLFMQQHEMSWIQRKAYSSSKLFARWAANVCVKQDKSRRYTVQCPNYTANTGKRLPKTSYMPCMPNKTVVMDDSRQGCPKSVI
jgi:hypothetical protein